MFDNRAGAFFPCLLFSHRLIVKGRNLLALSIVMWARLVFRLPLPTFWSPFPIRSACALLALVAVVLVPSAARATCGDYLHQGERNGMEKSVATQSLPSQMPLTCTGPQCSKQRD